MDIRTGRTSNIPPSHICTSCSGLNLDITDFFNADATGEIRLDSWGSFRKVKLGTFIDIDDRVDCPICCLAVKVISLKSPGQIDPRSSTEYEACLRWEDPVWDKEVMKVRRPVFLGFCSDYDRFDIQFVPSLFNAAFGGALTIQYSARRLQTITDKGSLARQWLNTCINKHGTSCGETHFWSARHSKYVWEIPHLILIDVHEHCLVDAPVACTYVALSYLWGRESFFNLTKSNISRLQQPGSLKKHTRLLPKTISDAIYFTSQIGERYLWVDSLCIVQDDRDQKHTLIDSMDVIFSGALLTIIAATGRDASAGLFQGRAFTEKITEGLDLTGIDFFQSRHEQGKWVHETRGWTYQEQLLSKRQIVFADGLTFFVCSKSVRREDLVTEETEIVAGEGEITKYFQRPLTPGKNPATAISTYISCVEAYSRRDLSFAQDGLNAFAGISKILENYLETTLFYGLPIKYFELALLWTQRGRNLTRRKGFPSWSWAGWSGGVDISSVRRASDFARLAGVIKDRNNFEYYEPSVSKFLSLEAYCNSGYVSYTNFGTDSANIQNRFDYSEHVNKLGLIQFEAQYATFTIALFEQTQEKNERPNLGILDADDNLIGELEDGHELQIESLPNLLGVHEVIVISEKHSESWHYELFPSSYKPSNTLIKSARPAGQRKPRASGNGLLARDSASAFPRVTSMRSRLDMKMHNAKDWDLFNVMVVEWHNGIAYRLGVGWIFKEALFAGVKDFESGPATKKVILG